MENKEQCELCETCKVDKKFFAPQINAVLLFCVAKRMMG